MNVPAAPLDPRSPERKRHQFEVERELSERLRKAPARERPRLYAEVYEEFFRRVPDAPLLAHKADPAAQVAAVRARIGLILPLLRPGATFLEAGPGDCSLAFEVARHARRVIALEVSRTIAERSDRPPNFELRLFDGIEIVLPPGSVDVAYSDQLLEHLHPEDVPVHLDGMFRALAPGGAYVCITPHRLTGPHDGTKYTDQPHPVGLHLHEYSLGELRRLFARAGFRGFAVYQGTRPFPLWPSRALEVGMSVVPRPIRRRPKLRELLGIRLLARR